MEILEIIDQLEEKIERAGNIPVLNRSMIDKEELLADIEDIRLQLPEELKQARWLKEERKRIIAEANQEAETIIKNTEEKAIALVNEHEIAKKAYEHANEIINAAQKRAQDTCAQAVEYCDGILMDMQQKFEAILATIKQSREGLRK